MAALFFWGVMPFYNAMIFRFRSIGVIQFKLNGLTEEFCEFGVLANPAQDSYARDKYCKYLETLENLKSILCDNITP